MIRPRGALADVERPLEERRGVGIAALVEVEQRQAVEARGHVGVVGTEHCLAHRQRLVEALLGLGVAAPHVMEQRQIV